MTTADTHADLMRVTDAPRAAYDRESAAGHEGWATFIHDLLVGVYRAAAVVTPGGDGGGR
jgi:hypothetical protein